MRTDFYTALGNLTAQFAFTEEWMKYFIALLLNKEDEKLGRSVVADMSFQPLWHALMSLYRYTETDPKLVKKLEDLLREIQKLATKRNDLIHSYWFVGNPSKQIMRIKTKAKFDRGLQMTIEPMDVEQVQSIVREINVANDRLIDFVLDWSEAHPPKAVNETVKGSGHTHEETTSQTPQKE